MPELFNLAEAAPQPIVVGAVVILYLFDSQPLIGRTPVVGESRRIRHRGPRLINQQTDLDKSHTIEMKNDRGRTSKMEMRNVLNAELGTSSNTLSRSE